MRTLLLLTLCLCASNIWANEDSDDLINSIDELTALIDSLEARVGSETDSAKKSALDDGLDALRLVSQMGIDLKSNLSDRVGNSTSDQVKDIQKQLKDWEREQLQRVSEATDGAGLREAKRVTSDFIKSYDKALQDCQSDLNKLQEKSEKLIQEQVKNYEKKVKKLVEEMEKCAKKSTKSKDCQKKIDNSVRELSNAPKDLMKLRANDKPLVNAEKQASQCVEDAQFYLDLHKRAIEKTLDKIIEENASKSGPKKSNSSKSNPKPKKSESKEKSNESASNEDSDESGSKEKSAPPKKKGNAKKPAPAEKNLGDSEETEN